MSSCPENALDQIIGSTAPQGSRKTNRLAPAASCNAFPMSVPRSGVVEPDGSRSAGPGWPARAGLVGGGPIRSDQPFGWDSYSRSEPAIRCVAESRLRPFFRSRRERDRARPCGAIRRDRDPRRGEVAARWSLIGSPPAESSAIRCMPLIGGLTEGLLVAIALFFSVIVWLVPGPRRSSGPRLLGEDDAIDREELEEAEREVRDLDLDRRPEVPNGG